MTEHRNVDDRLETMIRRHGWGEVLASLCRVANNRNPGGTLFRKLNRVYEWLEGKEDAL